MTEIQYRNDQTQQQVVEIAPLYHDVKNGVTISNAAESISTDALDASTNTFSTSPAHDLLDNDIVQINSGSGGTIPTGISADTEYYVEYVAANFFKLRNTLDGDEIEWTGGTAGFKFQFIARTISFSQNTAGVLFVNTHASVDMDVQFRKDANTWSDKFPVKAGKDISLATRAKEFRISSGTSAGAFSVLANLEGSAE